MAEWEDEDIEQEEIKEEQKQVVFNEFDDESEVIPEEKKQITKTINPKDKNEVDYEKKYQARKKNFQIHMTYLK